MVAKFNAPFVSSLAATIAIFGPIDISSHSSVQTVSYCQPVSIGLGLRMLTLIGGMLLLLFDDSYAYPKWVETIKAMQQHPQQKLNVEFEQRWEKIRKLEINEPRKFIEQSDELLADVRQKPELFEELIRIHQSRLFAGDLMGDQALKATLFDAAIDDIEDFEEDDPLELVRSYLQIVRRVKSPDLAARVSRTYDKCLAILITKLPKQLRLQRKVLSNYYQHLMVQMTIDAAFVERLCRQHLDLINLNRNLIVDRENLTCLEVLTTILSDQSRHQELIALSQPVIMLDLQNDNAWNLLMGITTRYLESMIELERWQETESLIKNLLARQDEVSVMSIHLHRQLINAMQKQGKYDQAADYCQKISGLKKLDPKFKIELVQKSIELHIYLTKFQDALQLMNQLENLISKPLVKDPLLNARVQFSKARLLMAMAEYQKAKEIYIGLARFLKRHELDNPLTRSTLSIDFMICAELLGDKKQSKKCAIDFWQIQEHDPIGIDQVNKIVALNMDNQQVIEKLLGEKKYLEAEQIAQVEMLRMMYFLGPGAQRSQKLMDQMILILEQTSRPQEAGIVKQLKTMADYQPECECK